MNKKVSPTVTSDRKDWDIDSYRLQQQIGFILRQVSQRHASIFASRMPGDLTPTQFAVLAKLREKGALGQNELGRHTAMDAATIKGVVDRLGEKGLVQAEPDRNDRRRRLISLSPSGQDLAAAVLPAAFEISETTLAVLKDGERQTFMTLLQKLV